MIATDHHSLPLIATDRHSLPRIAPPEQRGREAERIEIAARAVRGVLSVSVSEATGTAMECT